MVNIPTSNIWLKNAKKRIEWEVAVNPFSISNVPITQELYNNVIPEYKLSPYGKNLPATNISWIEAVKFCNALSETTNLEQCYKNTDDYRQVQCSFEANGFRLPSEAEWELACRATTQGQIYAPLDDIAWFSGNSEGKVHTVGLKQPNEFGLYDMIGNVWEWCWDLYDTEIYGQYRVFRGGGFSDNERSCRASCRRKSHPTFKIEDLGFRVCRTIAI